MSTILEGLTKKQLHAVVTTQGPLLIIAGAGSGKTTVITRRIAYIIEGKLAKPSQILALTFTDKAASEMEERVDLLVPYGWVDTWICTFHAFGDRLLRQHALELGMPPDFRILTKAEQFLFVQQHLFSFDLSHFRPLSNPTRFIQAMLSLVSRAKDEDVGPKEYADYVTDLSLQPGVDQIEAERQWELAKFYQQYESLKDQAGLVDFGDLVVLTLKLFRQHPQILKKYQDQFQYILVDEYQDTNYSQNELAKILAQKNNNICVVGDDDQAIYRFRGAAISNILQFKQNFPKTKQIVLKENFRSTQATLDAAYRLISHNNPDRLEVKNHIDKKLISQRKQYGLPPQELFGQTLSEEADLVASEINRLVRDNHQVADNIKQTLTKNPLSYRDLAILVRANSQARPFIEALNFRNIPCQFAGSSGLYEQEEIRLIICFLKSIVNFDDSASLYQLAISDVYQLSVEDCIKCMNLVSRQNKTLRWVFQRHQELRQLEISPEGEQIISRIMSDLKRFIEFSRKATAGRVVYEFLQDSSFFHKLQQDGSGQSVNQIANIAKFFEKIQEFSRLVRDGSVRNFTDYLELMRQAGEDPATADVDPSVDAVNIMTVHAAKGLEFAVVFLVNLVVDRFPTRYQGEGLELPDALIKETLPSGDYHLQEERRLFYVGVTRAKDLVYLSWARDYGGKRLRKISPFVLEALDKQEIDHQASKSSPLEKIHQIAFVNQPTAAVDQAARIDDRVVSLSQQQIDDYITCPWKYRYSAILRVPVLKHHTVVYGAALHKTVEHFYLQKMGGNVLSLEELWEVFEHSWEQEGFLSAEHESLRLIQGKKVLADFWRREKDAKHLPTFIEKPFRVNFGRVRLVGRMDRIDIEEDRVTILDFKSSEGVDQQQANKRARDSIQLGVYALAYQKMYGLIPQTVGLYFLETGIIGQFSPTQQYLDKVSQSIDQVARGIEVSNFAATPSMLACSVCAFNSICPYSMAKVR